ncbi:MAG: hypothetical protein U1F08_03425 [Steroidobacteraceae bacterium]
MTAFRILLIVILVVLLSYTSVVIANHGLGLLPVFFGDMAQVAWPGQFNLDFMFMLTLSAVWVAWRHEFTPAGLALGLAAFLGGSLFLSIYLLVVMRGSDALTVLVGPARRPSPLRDAS